MSAPVTLRHQLWVQPVMIPARSPHGGCGHESSNSESIRRLDEARRRAEEVAIEAKRYKSRWEQARLPLVRAEQEQRRAQRSARMADAAARLTGVLLAILVIAWVVGLVGQFWIVLAAMMC
jgi:Flp pilus assembly protein TadB